MAKASEPVIQEKGKSAIDTSILDTIQGDLPSNKKTMSPIDIYRNYFKSIYPQANTDVLLAYLGARLSSPKRSLVQLGNTLFNVYRVSPTEVEFDMATNESPKKIFENSVGFAKFLKNQKIKTAKTIAEKPETVKLVQKVAESQGLDVNVGQSTEKLDGVMKPVYTIEVTL